MSDTIKLTGDAPEWLRAVTSYGITLSPGACAMLADAVEIADSCAESDLVCNCRQEDGWCDTRLDDEPGDHEWMTRALRYLDARGLLERKPGEAHMVRVLETTLSQGRQQEESK